MTEGQELDKKSLRVLSLDSHDWSWRKLASDSVAFANARGGSILFGIEDDASLPPSNQRVTSDLADTTFASPMSRAQFTPRIWCVSSQKGIPTSGKLTATGGFRSNVPILPRSAAFSVNSAPPSA